VSVDGIIQRDNSSKLPPSLFSDIVPDNRWMLVDISDIRVSELNDTVSLAAFLRELKQKIISIFKINLRIREAALLSGLVFGERELLDEGFSESLKRSGLVHIVVASGFNVMVVSGFLLSVLVHFIPRRKAIVIS